MASSANESNAIFQEALSLLDDFYAIDGIDFVTDTWPHNQRLDATTSAPTLAPAPVTNSTSSDISETPDVEDADVASVDGRTTSTTSSVAGGSGNAPRRNRQREELLRLRDEAKQLDQRLSDLKQRRKNAAAAANAMSQEERDMMALWEKIAVRQQSERQRVEIENTKLRDLFSAQTRVAQELRRLLEKQMKAHVRLLCTLSIVRWFVQAPHALSCI
jgi:hypothetical protein